MERIQQAQQELEQIIQQTAREGIGEGLKGTVEMTAVALAGSLILQMLGLPLWPALLIPVGGYLHSLPSILRNASMLQKNKKRWQIPVTVAGQKVNLWVDDAVLISYDTQKLYSELYRRDLETAHVQAYHILDTRLRTLIRNEHKLGKVESLPGFLSLFIPANVRYARRESAKFRLIATAMEYGKKIVGRVEQSSCYEAIDTAAYTARQTAYRSQKVSEMMNDLSPRPTLSV